MVTARTLSMNFPKLSRYDVLSSEFGSWVFFSVTRYSAYQSRKKDIAVLCLMISLTIGDQLHVFREIKSNHF